MAKPIQRWEEKIGSRPTVTVYERAERGLDVYVRWPNGKSYRKRKLTLGTIRDASGRIDPVLQEAARAEAFAFRSTLVSAPEQQPSPVPSDGGQQGDESPLTLAEGFAIYFHPENGSFPTETQHVGDVRRASQHIMRILGDETTWESLSSASYQYLWRALAREHSATGKHGLNACGKICAALQAASAFLSPKNCVMPMQKRWKEKMTAEWLQITGQRAKDIAPQTPRFTTDEAGRLFQALWESDPRIALLVELGAEDRLGQVVRCRRSDLNLENETHNEGTLYIPGSGKKRGGLNAITREQRARVNAALSAGHLRTLEAAYQSGDLEDYPLFPGGPMSQGLFKLAAATRPQMSKRSIASLFRELENTAGVEHRPGRGWYGIRRIATDLAEDITGDERALNHISKHADSTMRRRIYQEAGRPKVINTASATVEAIRRQLQTRAPEDTGTASDEGSSGPKPNPET